MIIPVYKQFVEVRTYREYDDPEPAPSLKPPVYNLSFEPRPDDVVENRADCLHTRRWGAADRPFALIFATGGRLVDDGAGLLLRTRRTAKVKGVEGPEDLQAIVAICMAEHKIAGLRLLDADDRAWREPETWARRGHQVERVEPAPPQAPEPEESAVPIGVPSSNFGGVATHAPDAMMRDSRPAPDDGPEEDHFDETLARVAAMGAPKLTIVCHPPDPDAPPPAPVHQLGFGWADEKPAGKPRRRKAVGP